MCSSCIILTFVIAFEASVFLLTKDETAEGGLNVFVAETSFPNQILDVFPCFIHSFVKHLRNFDKQSALNFAARITLKFIKC